METKSGVYKILNTVNSKFYIGSSEDMDIRWGQHVNALNRGKHRNRHLQRAWNLYGEISFTNEKIEIVERLKDETIEAFRLRLVNGREQYYLDTLTPWDRNIGYNINKLATSSLGVKRSEETKEKIRQANLGKIQSQEHKDNISKGVKNSDKHQKAVHSLEFKEKQRINNLGPKNPMYGNKRFLGENNHMFGKFGKDHHRAVPLLQYTKFGEFVREWDSLMDAERGGFGHANVSSCCHGRLMSAYGFVWKYKD